jgi:hypothetical protein
MTIPSSPSIIYLSNVKSEFGTYGSPATPSNLTAYLKSSPGKYLGPSPFTTGVNTTLPLKLSSFSGTANNNTGTPTFNNVYTTSGSSGNQPIQPGTRLCVIECWGPGGGGGGGAGSSIPFYPGGGGGSGGYVRSAINMPATNSSAWGTNLAYNVGTASSGSGTNANVVVAATNPYPGTFTSMQAGGGSRGTNGVTPTPGTGGPGGGASGGTANNTPGNAGAVPTSGAAITGSFSTPTMPAASNGAGGNGGLSGPNPAQPGAAGAVRFTWL